MAERPIELAVVGHTNAGKTSLLRTLTRRADFGRVSDQPGTTRHVETIVLRVDGVPAVRFADTPGLEDPVALLELVKSIPQGPSAPGSAPLPGPAPEGVTEHGSGPSFLASPTDRVRAFLRRPEAAGAFEQEAKVLRALLDADCAFYVIDCREAVLPKYHCEIELLNACATPLMPVLNQLRHPDSREAQWRRALAEHGLHAQAGFDAVAPFVGAEVRLYRDLATLLGAQRGRLDAVADFLAREQAERRRAALRCIAGHLIALAAQRRTLPREVVDDAARKAAAVAGFRQSVAARARRAADEVLQVSGFRPDEADLAQLPALAGRWEDDLFNPQVLQAAARRLGTGAAVGAAIGLGLDVALAGLSLGAAATLGATIGGLASQGFGPMGRALVNKLSGQQDLTLDDDVLLVVADRLLRLVAALEQRGHAAFERVPAAADAPLDAQSPLIALLRALQPARGRPDWAEDGAASPWRDDVVEALVPVLEAATGGKPGDGPTSA